MLKREIVAKVKEVVAEANKKFPRLNMSVPAVEFYEKGTIAGKAYPTKHLVKYNMGLAESNPDTFYETVIHEVSHLVHRKMHPYERQAHCANFYNIDKMLGGRGTRCHSYDVSAVKVVKTYTRHLCVCSCDTPHKVTPKVAARASFYTCRKCKSKLSNTGKTIQVTK